MKFGKNSTAWAYGVAIVLPALGLTVQDLLYSRIGGLPSPFILAYPAVFLIVWIGGWGPGLIATLLAAIGAWYHFLPPYDSFAIPHLPDLLKLGVFVTMGVFFSVLIPASRKRIQEENHDFNTLLAHTSDFIYFKDKDSRIRFSSQAMADVCGYPNWREMIGKHDFEIFPEETARIYYEEELPIFRDGIPLLNKINPYIDVKGERRWVSTNKWPVFDGDGKTVVGIFGISRDVTEQKRAEAGREQFYKFFQTSTDLMGIADPLGAFKQVNPAFTQTLGFPEAELLAKPFIEFVHPDDRQRTADEMADQLRKGFSLNFENRYLCKDGTLRWLSWHANVSQTEGLTYATARDITERKRTEENLRRAAAELVEANRLKDVFTDVLRHDILNPATAIKISTELLLSGESDPRKNELLQRIHQSTLNLVEMTQNAAKLASVSAGQALEFIPADPVQLLRTVLPDFDHKLAEKNMTLTDHSGDGFSAYLHPVMKDVFANLVSNAIKYSPVGSRIDVGVEDRGDAWVLSVKDQGAGVPDEHKQKIFNRFERLGKEGVKGSGLGLTIAKQVVSLHCGEIWVEDNPSGGSIFFVSLPKIPGASS